MIYDEGFEIFIGNLNLFHFNHYEKPRGNLNLFIKIKDNLDILLIALRLY